jgi:hypothetical protein
MNGGKKSILQTIEVALDHNGKLPYGLKLPDDDTFFGEDKLSYIGGLYENIMPSGDPKSIANKMEARRILYAIRRYASDSTNSNKDFMYKRLASKDSIFFLNYVISKLNIPSAHMTVFQNTARVDYIPRHIF